MFLEDLSNWDNRGKFQFFVVFATLNQIMNKGMKVGLTGNAKAATFQEMFSKNWNNLNKGKHFVVDSELK